MSRGTSSNPPSGQPTPPDPITAIQAQLSQLQEQIQQLSRVPVEHNAPQPTTADDAWKATLALQNVLQRQTTAASQVTIPLPNHPIGVAFLPDIHLGGRGTDHAQILTDTELIRKTPGLYCLLQGDGIDNFITGGRLAAAARSSVVQPDLQWVLYEDLLARLAGKILAVGTGNHEAWTRAMAGVDKLAEIVRSLRLCYIQHGGTIVLRFASGQEYQIAIRHGFRYHSQINLTHRPKRMWEQLAMDADVAVVGDKHEAAIEMCRRQGLARIFIACSTYKLDDDFAQSLGFPRSEAIIPTIIFRPDTRSLAPFWNLRDASDYLKYLRKI